MLTAKKITRYIADQAIDFLLPPLCYKCRTQLINNSQLCPSCWQDIDFITKPYCAVNGTPLPYSIDNKTISAEALSNPPVYRRLRSVAHYQNTMRDLIHQLKYNDKHEITDLFAVWLTNSGKELIDDNDLLIPIPLYPWRLWQRRFNQAALLSYALAKSTGLEVNCETLVRVKNTKPQFGLSLKERELNVRGAFNIKKENQKIIQNKNILLLDDIITTGSTVNTAAKTLLMAGALNVDVLSLAIVTKDLPSLAQ